MNGFQKEIRARILGVASHIQIADQDNTLADWQKVAARARENPRVLAAAPYVNGQALLEFGGTVRGALVRDVDPKLEAEVADVGDHMVAERLDSLQPGEFGVVRSEEHTSE